MKTTKIKPVKITDFVNSDTRQYNFSDASKFAIEEGIKNVNKKTWYTSKFVEKNALEYQDILKIFWKRLSLENYDFLIASIKNILLLKKELNKLNYNELGWCRYAEKERKIFNKINKEKIGVWEYTNIMPGVISFSQTTLNILIDYKNLILKP